MDQLTKMLTDAGLALTNVETDGDGDTTFNVGKFIVLVTAEPMFNNGNFHFLARGPVSKTEGVDSGWMEKPEQVLRFLEKYQGRAS